MYRGEIDTLRALAVFGVIFFHLDFLYIKGGFLGVDIFFVISGFLISRIIFEKINLNTFSYKEFFIRRIKRIFPLLFVVCITTAFFAFIKFQPSEIEFLGTTLASVSLLISNILFYFEVSYFNETASQSPLLHTWSLSVEEQFYLVFPIITFFIISKFSKKTFLFILIIISILSLIIAEYYSRLSLENIFFLTQFRIFELSIGVFCSFFDYYHPKKLNIIFKTFPKLTKSFSLISLSLIILSFLILNDKSYLPGLLSLWPTIPAAIFILTIREFKALLVILNYKYLVTLGKMSYSLYLWHFPLIIFFPFFLKDLNFIFYFLVLIFISFLSWRFIELPFRNYNYNSKNIFVYYIIGSLILLLLDYFFIFLMVLKKFM